MKTLDRATNEINYRDMEARLDGPPIGDGRYSQAELRAGFNLVADRDNWKMPIDAWIAADLFVLADRGTIHFAGCHLAVVGVDTRTNRLHVTAPGYYSAIGS